jgi:hypothetical protein
MGMIFDSRHSLQRKAKRGLQGYPLATIAYYGPDNQRASKIVVGIVDGKNELLFMERWFSESGDIRFDRNVHQQILDFVRKHNAKSVVMTDRIIGCPHEEGTDYPEGKSCPQCPFWENRDRFTGELIH